MSYGSDSEQLYIKIFLVGVCLLAMLYSVCTMAALALLRSFCWLLPPKLTIIIVINMFLYTCNIAPLTNSHDSPNGISNRWVNA